MKINLEIPNRKIYAFIIFAAMALFTYHTLSEIVYQNIFKLSEKIMCSFEFKDITKIWYPIIAYISLSLTLLSFVSIFKKTKRIGNPLNKIDSLIDGLVYGFIYSPIFFIILGVMLAVFDFNTKLEIIERIKVGITVGVTTGYLLGFIYGAVLGSSKENK